MLLSKLQDFKKTDIYLWDQIMRGHISPGMSVLDIACGSGRNIPILLEIGCDVTGMDLDRSAIDHCSQHYPKANFFQTDINNFQSEKTYDLVIANAIFHFAPDQEGFINWTQNAWNAVKDRGLFFSRLSTKISLPEGVHPPHFSYLATEEDLEIREQAWNARRVDPLKTTLVEKQRTMTTWVLKKD